MTYETFIDTTKNTKCIELEMGPEEFTILRLYMACEADTERCGLCNRFAHCIKVGMTIPYLPIN